VSGMVRVLGIELRRSAAPGAAVLLALAGLLMLWQEPPGWLDGWTALAVTQRTEGLLVWPLALAAGAWQARRAHLAGVAELTASTPAPPRRRIVPVSAAMTLAAAAAYLLATVAGAVAFTRSATYRPPAALGVVAVGVVAVVAAVCLGLAVGRLLPSAVTAPALAVVGIGVVVVGGTAAERLPWVVQGLSPVMPRTIFQVHFLDFLTVSPRVSLAQAAWLGGLALTGLALFAVDGRRARAYALAPALVGAGIALTLVPHTGAAPGAVLDEAARALVCADGAPRVCVSRVHESRLPEVTATVRTGLARIARLPDAPTVAVEDLSSWNDPVSPPPAGTARFATLSGEPQPDSEQVVLRTLTRSVLDPLECGGAATMAAVGWLDGMPPDAEFAAPPEVVELRKTLDALPPNEALRRVQALRVAAAAGCTTPLDGVLSAGPAA
jgi:hypothetical protein